jgi:predicted amidophosphoribosyltransferase
MTVESLLEPLTDLVLPRRCVGCGARGRALCATCTGTDPVFGRRGDLTVVSGAAYAGGVRAAVIAYKERGRRDLAGPLAALLSAALAVGWAGPVVLVPIPSTRRAAVERGGDHVRRLAHRAAARGGFRVAIGALDIGRTVRDSAGLSAPQRAANLAGAMRAQPPPPRDRVAVLVDDIVTTGATLQEARRALEAAGWLVTGAATVASTPRLTHTK